MAQKVPLIQLVKPILAEVVSSIDGEFDESVFTNYNFFSVFYDPKDIEHKYLYVSDEIVLALILV